MILLQLKLPKMGGKEALGCVKADPLTRNIPVAILEFSQDQSDVFESYHLGVNSNTGKLASLGQFVRAVRELGMYGLLLTPAPILE